MANTPGKATYNVPEKGLPDIPAQKNKRVCKDAGHAVPHMNISVWLWEMLNLMMSVSCVVAILAILDHYDQQPVPNWSYGFTLTNVVSILAVVVRSSLILPIAETMSQLKWSWFWRGHRLVMELERFDSASRGSWGSLMLLSHPRSRNFAAFRAALTITSLWLNLHCNKSRHTCQCWCGLVGQKLYPEAPIIMMLSTTQVGMNHELPLQSFSIPWYIRSIQ